MAWGSAVFADTDDFTRVAVEWRRKPDESFYLVLRAGPVIAMGDGPTLPAALYDACVNAMLGVDADCEEDFTPRQRESVYQLYTAYMAGISREGGLLNVDPVASVQAASPTTSA